MRRRTLLLASAASWSAASGMSVAKDRTPPLPKVDLVVGQLANLSGPGAVRQLAFNAGARMVLEAFNAGGGAQGHRLRWISLDHRGREDLAAATARQMLINERASVLFGCSGNATHLALAPLQRQAGVAAIGGVEVSDAVRLETSRWSYFVPAGQTRMAQALARHLSDLGLRRVAAVHEAAPGHIAGQGLESSSWLRLLHDACLGRQLTWVGSAAVTEDPGTAQEAVRKLSALSPQALLLVLPGQRILTLLDSLDRQSRAPACYALPMGEVDGVLQQAGSRARLLTLCQNLPSPWSTRQAVILEFRRQAGLAGVAVSYPALEGWLAAQLLTEALRRCGPDLRPSRIHESLDRLQMHLGGMTVDFNRRELSGSRLVELVRPSADGRWLP